MNNKSLFIRYIVLFFVCSFLGLAFLNWYKNIELNNFLLLTTSKLKKSYDLSYEEAQKIAEISLYNNILLDEKIINIYKEIPKNSFEARKKLYEHTKNKFFYLKSFGIKQINFYLPNNETFLRMKTPKQYGDVLKYKETLQYVNSSLKDINSIEIGKNYPSIRFIKPIFDKKLNHLGSVEVGYSFDCFANSIENHSTFNTLFLFKNELIKENIIKSRYEDFKPFVLNKKYLFEKNIYQFHKYKGELFSKIDKKRKKEIEKSMNYSKTLSFYFTYENEKHLMVLMPLRNRLTNENIAYALFYSVNKIDEQVFIEKYFTYICIGLLFIIALVIFLLLLLKISKNRKKDFIKKYQTLLNAIDKYVVMVETDKRGFITDATQAFCDVCKYRKSELIGENMSILRHPDVSNKFFRGMWEKLNSLGTWEGEIKNIDKNGNSYWVKSAIFPKYNLMHEIVGYLSIRVDITDAKQLKKVNALLKEDLSNKLYEIKMKDKNLMSNTKVELMGKILDSVAHQWKSPISAISIELVNMLSRIEKKELNEDSLIQIHDEIEYQLKTLSITLNEFKSFFNNKIQYDKYNLKDTLDDVLIQIKDECRLHDIQIVSNLEKDIYCYGTYQELKHILLNLLKNSMEQLITLNIKNAKIGIFVLNDEDNILLKLTDNANGTTKKIFDKIFDEQYEEKVIRDLGLNIYTARLLVEKIGASMWVEKVDDTTEVYIKLVSQDRRKHRRT